MRKTVLGAAMHFLVDGLCLCCLYLLSASAGDASIAGVFIAYNVLAFLTQPLSGLLADHLRHPHWQLLASLALLLLAVLTATVSATNASTAAATLPAVAVVLGSGNSLFHTWGGKQVTVATGNDIRALGVFVSTGAFGLAVGMAFCSWPLLCVMLVSLCALSLTYLHVDQPQAEPQSAPDSETAATTYKPLVVFACILALMAVVMLRSLTGGVLSAGIGKGHVGAVLLVGVLVMVGKAAGGWIARWLGVWRAFIALVVLVAACCMLHEGGSPVLLCGLFLVNCTMPITLYLANVVMPRREGLAFGLLAAALMPGYLL